MDAAESQPPAAPAEPNERKIILLLGCLAAIHVFIYSAAFPFFNNIDEPAHFDLVLKYSHGLLPRGMATFSADAAIYLSLYSSCAFMGTPDMFPEGRLPPPPWTQPAEKMRSDLAINAPSWRAQKNYEISQAPLYYAVAGLWWKAGQGLGFEGGRLLYWLRFLNMLLVVAVVWLGYLAARTVFPENIFLRLGVPALLAFFPQTSFYSIQNSLLSSLCFGAAFIGLVHLLRTDAPTIRLAAAAGLALAATFLTKAVNIPLIAISMLMVSLKILRLPRTGASFRALATLALCAGIPAGLWMVWCEYHFGDFTGSAQNIQYCGITAKPFGEWWHHPIFTPHGFWTFLSDLLARFWQGEFLWHNQPLAGPAADVIYPLISIGLVTLVVVNLCLKKTTATGAQQQILWFSIGCFSVLVAFWGFESIIYNFEHCPNPTPEYPYFATGRYLLGAVIPFFLVFVYGLDRALGRFGLRVKFLALGGLILFMLISEIVVDWPVFSSPYNWFHLP